MVKVMTKEKEVELREDRSLYPRMMTMCNSCPDINIKETVGQYKFSLVPRSLFAADGSILHRSFKSALLAILEKVQGEIPRQNVNEESSLRMGNAQMTVDIVDGMAELQSLHG